METFRPLVTLIYYFWIIDHKKEFLILNFCVIFSIFGVCVSLFCVITVRITSRKIHQIKSYPIFHQLSIHHTKWNSVTLQKCTEIEFNFS